MGKYEDCYDLEENHRCVMAGCTCQTWPSYREKEGLQVTFNPGDKFDGDKPRYDLIPAEPIHELAKLYTVGAQKYDDWNWAKGLNYSRLYSAIQRHLYAWWQEDEKVDPKMQVNHLISVIWNTIALYEMAKAHPEMDDRPWIKGNED